MTKKKSKLHRFLALIAVAIVASLMTTSSPAEAQSIIKNPGDHPNYRFELEPHVNFGWARFYSGSGFGLGARGSVVLIDNGFVKTINNSVALTFGFDFLRYGDCYFYDGRSNRSACGATYLMFPIAMQWNFWLTPRWSVFGEPGAYVYHGIFGSCDGLPGCVNPTTTSIDFAFWAGGRFHFNDTVALTMRIGYPTLSLGVSFLF